MTGTMLFMVVRFSCWMAALPLMLRARLGGLGLLLAVLWRLRSDFLRSEPADSRDFEFEWPWESAARKIFFGLVD